MVYYSTSILLYSTDIDPRRNLCIEQFERYLAQFTGYSTFEDFKRFTPSESVTVKIPVSDAQPAVGGYLASRWNYAKFLYSDEDSGSSFSWY